MASGVNIGDRENHDLVPPLEPFYLTFCDLSVGTVRTETQ